MRPKYGYDQLAAIMPLLERLERSGICQLGKKSPKANSPRPRQNPRKSSGKTCKRASTPRLKKGGIAKKACGTVLGAGNR